MSFFFAKLASFSKVSSVNIDPIGFDGLIITIALVFSVTRPSSSSKSIWKSFSSARLYLTGTAPIMWAALT